MLSQFANTMRVSGYNYWTRYSIIWGIVMRQRQVELEIREGTRQRFRSGREIRDQKENRPDQAPNTWFLRGSNTCTLNVQCTPNSALKNTVQSAIGKHQGPDGGTTMVIEDSGTSVMSGLRRPDPFLSNTCQYQTRCYADENTDCNQNRCVYRILCNICGVSVPYKPSAYTGTTGCSLHKRLTEHHDATVRNDQKNALAKHLARYHPGVIPSNLTFSASIIDRQKYNLQRYISESLQIEKLTKIPEMMVMNSKGEWGRQKLTRIKFTDNTEG